MESIDVKITILVFQIKVHLLDGMGVGTVVPISNKQNDILDWLILSINDASNAIGGEVTPIRQAFRWHCKGATYNTGSVEASKIYPGGFKSLMPKDAYMRQ